MRHWRLYSALLLLAIFVGYTTIPIKFSDEKFVSFNKGLLIAHAGGGLPEQGTYTNTLEAMDKAVENGFKYIELDFARAENGELILLHDWDYNYFRLFSRFPRLPRIFRSEEFVRSKTALDFKSLTMRGGLTSMSLEDLMVWLKKNPDIFIITDIKGNNIAALQKIRDSSEVLQSRFIPQIYSPNEYEPVKSLGFENIILTTYKLAISSQDLVSFCESKNLFALTIPQSWVKHDVFSQLSTLDIRILTHTVNSSQAALEYMEMGVEGVYTDYLYPDLH